ncbi:MAG: hypothetical protein IPJ90_20650 [Anaerolineaceae bacterium]|nr:hypothetical protein [Anaerolineaceae bacterium]
MKYEVYANEKCIGESTLTKNDDGMGVYIGRFAPASSYDEVRSVFLLYTKSAVIREKTGQDDKQLLHQFFIERDKLNLSLRQKNGVIIPTSWILILDFQDEIPEDELEIHVQVTEPDLLKTPRHAR